MIVDPKAGVKAVLTEVHKAGLTQLEEIRKPLKTPTRTVTHVGQKWTSLGGIFLPQKDVLADVATEPDSFLLQMLSAFWKLFATISEKVEEPISVFAIRPVVELAFRQIVWYSLQNPEAQKEIAVKYWLYNTAWILNGGKDERWLSDYKKFMALLNPSGEKEFSKIQQDGFQLDKIANGLHRLFPSITDSQILAQLEPYLEELWGVKFSKDYVGKAYRHFSLYTHAHLFAITNLENYKTSKKHMFSCATLLVFSGYHILNFIDKEILKQNADFSGLKSMIAEVVPALYKSFSSV